ncbi:hypothetical protein CVT25_014049 [Psilocybe cyanescens]|uniref:Uncharacterized protein n=1 Tax=Psilocybe cyanescens TaxID=93625 RepID=A0A409X548_PSICY|nr:hypothetical protein CVT25_014049 [Psilocybe cyanescens]
MKDQKERLFQRKLCTSESKVDQMVTLLEEQNAELKGVHTFLTTADLYSGADIIQVVDTLNANNFQMLASYEECIRNLKTCQHPLKTISETIGADLCTHLANKFTPVQTEDPLPLQLAI